MSEEIRERFLPLLALAKDRSRRLDLLELENVRLAARFKNAHPKAYAQFILGLSAWEVLSHFKAEVTRRSAAAKREKEEDEQQAAAMERLAKADRDGLSRINEGHPTDVARDFLTQVRPNLIVTNGEWLDFSVNHYRAFEKATIRSDLQKWMDNAVSAETGNRVLVTKKILDDVMDALSGATHLPADTVKPPSWLEPGEDDPEPRSVIACHNGLLNVRTLDLRANTPRFFTRNGLPYDFEDPFFVLPPYEFLRFLEQVWPEAEGGLASKESLQEWFGYLLTPGNALQKILLLMGESRAGKGVIIKILTALVGAFNVASVPFDSLSKDFGLQPLLGKSVMVVPDLVLTKESSKAMSQILAISGDDTVGVNRKFMSQVQERLDVRIVLATNYALSLPDQSGALANRLHPLVFTKWFGANPDLTLADRIIATELPGILHWALEGRARLEARGAFTMPEVSAKTLAGMRQQSGPVMAFVKERCVIEPGAVATRRDLWRAFEVYCEDRSIPNRYQPETFGRDITRNATGFSHVDIQRMTVDGRQQRVYIGLKLKPEFEKDLEEMDDDF